MIDPVKQALVRIYNTIPTEILNAAFKPFNSDESLDSLIINKIMLDRIRDDISVRGGKIFELVLDMKWCKYTTSPSPYALGISGSYSVYHIPPEARDHRDISAVLQIRFPYTLGLSTSGAYFDNSSVRGNTLSGLAKAALSAQTNSGTIAAPTGTILPGNQISLHPPQFNFIPWQVKVRLRYDDNFSGMDVSSIATFSQLCEYATKAYIYNKLIFDIETNAVLRGADIGVMREIVSNYSDANEKYDELIITMGGAETFDPRRLHGILARMVPRK